MTFQRINKISKQTQTPTESTQSQLKLRPFAPIIQRTTPSPHQQRQQTQGLVQRKTNLLEIPGLMVFPKRTKLPDKLIQAKQTIGQPGDKYEQEADSIAQQIVQRINQPQSNQIQQKSLLEEDELQMKAQGSIQQVQQNGSAVQAKSDLVQTKPSPNLLHTNPSHKQQIFIQRVLSELDSDVLSELDSEYNSSAPSGNNRAGGTKRKRSQESDEQEQTQVTKKGKHSQENKDEKTPKQTQDRILKHLQENPQESFTLTDINKVFRDIGDINKISNALKFLRNKGKISHQDNKYRFESLESKKEQTSEQIRDRILEHLQKYSQQNFTKADINTFLSDIVNQDKINKALTFLKSKGKISYQDNKYRFESLKSKDEQTPKQIQDRILKHLQENSQKSIPRADINKIFPDIVDTSKIHDALKFLRNKGKISHQDNKYRFESLESKKEQTLEKIRDRILEHLQENPQESFNLIDINTFLSDIVDQNKINNALTFLKNKGKIGYQDNEYRFESVKSKDEQTPEQIKDRILKHLQENSQKSFTKADINKVFLDIVDKSKIHDALKFLRNKGKISLQDKKYRFESSESKDEQTSEQIQDKILEHLQKYSQESFTREEIDKIFPDIVDKNKINSALKYLRNNGQISFQDSKYRFESLKIKGGQKPKQIQNRILEHLQENSQESFTMADIIQIFSDIVDQAKISNSLEYLRNKGKISYRDKKYRFESSESKDGQTRKQIQDKILEHLKENSQESFTKADINKLLPDLVDKGKIHHSLEYLRNKGKISFQDKKYKYESSQQDIDSEEEDSLALAERNRKKAKRQDNSEALAKNLLEQNPNLYLEKRGHGNGQFILTDDDARDVDYDSQQISRSQRLSTYASTAALVNFPEGMEFQASIKRDRRSIALSSNFNRMNELVRESIKTAGDLQNLAVKSLKKHGIEKMPYKKAMKNREIRHSLKLYERLPRYLGLDAGVVVPQSTRGEDGIHAEIRIVSEEEWTKNDWDVPRGTKYPCLGCYLHLNSQEIEIGHFHGPLWLTNGGLSQQLKASLNNKNTTNEMRSTQISDMGSTQISDTAELLATSYDQLPDDSEFAMGLARSGKATYSQDADSDSDLDEPTFANAVKRIKAHQSGALPTRPKKDVNGQFINQTVGDGNCFFHAVHEAMYNIRSTQADQATIRQRVIHELLENTHILQDVLGQIPDDNAITQEIDNLGEGQWTQDYHPGLVATALGLTIVIYHEQGGVPETISPLHNRPSHATIYMSFTGNHFNSHTRNPLSQ